MDVAVQWVRTSWTKRSRGGEAATRRNAVPVAFMLPQSGLPFVHDVRMDESAGFEPRIALLDGPPPVDDVDLRESDGLLRVHLSATPYGVPRRWRRPPAVRLARGEWLRWQINYRFSGTCSCGQEWNYRLDTLNLAYGPVDSGAFLGEPGRHIDERARLR
ncbi:hypothetical protein ACRYCC_37705 [Actinomadura scrupuli]|uniref:hypothetical protein n=1 Tax=Actinomadura scrupuli TaxID=559629 RepID=UPI003D95DC2F